MPEMNLLCGEKHKTIDEKLERHEQQIGAHDDRLGKLEQGQTRTEVVVQTLCDQIKTLVDTMEKQQKEYLHWFLGITGTIMGVLVGFVIWYIQSIPR